MREWSQNKKEQEAKKRETRQEVVISFAFLLCFLLGLFFSLDFPLWVHSGIESTNSNPYEFFPILIPI